MRHQDARTAFLAGLIDDAGLFPPARLPMDEALAAHLATKRGPYGWAVSRFGCPAGRLAEIPPELPLRLSVVVDGVGDLALVHRFAARARVELLEAPLAALRGFVDAIDSSGIPGPVQPVFEIPPTEIDAGLAALAELRAERDWTGTCRAPWAKIRCGGLTADAFPPPERLAAFIATAARLGVPFKATAGLHQPFRHVAADTGFTHHGFVNVVAASVFAQRCDQPLLRALIEDGDPAHFSLTREGLRWNELVAPAAAVAASREHALTAYGSCSTDEPLEALDRIGALPPTLPPTTLEVQA